MKRSKLLFLLPLFALLFLLVRGHSVRVPHSPKVQAGHSRRVRLGHFSMALDPDGYTASGAGASEYNVHYALGSGVDANGNQFLRNAATGSGIIYSSGFGAYQIWNAVSESGLSTGGAQYNSPATAAGTFPLTGWTTGYGTSPAPTFTVGSSDGTTLSPVSVTEPALLTGAASRGPLAFAARSAALLLLTQSAAMTGFSRAPVTFAPRIAVNSLFSEMPIARAPVTFAPRIAALSLLSESAPGFGATHPPIIAAEPPLLSVSASRGPAAYAPRIAAESVLIAEGARGGPAAPAGNTAPPIIAAEPPLLSVSASRGPLAFAARSAALLLLTQSAPPGPFTFSPRIVVLGPLLSASGAGGHLQPAPLPEAVDDRDPFVVLNAEIRHLLALLQGNPMSTNSTTLAILDKLAASYRINELSLLANTVADLPTLIRGGDGVSSTIYGYGQDQPILTLLPAADALIAQSAPNVVLTGIYRGFMAALQTFVSKQGYPSLNAYLSAQNTPTPYQALIHPNAALIEWLFNNQNGTLLLSPGNVFAPETLFGTAAITGAGAVSFTHLSAIPSANVVSSAPGLSTQGYTAARGVTASVTAAINGTLTVTITASGQSAAGALVTGRIWTAVLDNLAAGSSVAFAPNTAGDRIFSVTGCAGAGTATAGAFSLNSVLERIVS